jgi:hypothetical protein
MTRSSSDAQQRKTIINSTLRKLGADFYDMMLPETHSLAKVLASDETIEGIIYGRYHRSNGLPGRGVLAATDRRLIFIDHKPLSLNASEISYYVISGISHGTTGMVSIVVLNTRMGDMQFRTFNPRTPNSFVHAIESHIFQQPANFRPIRSTNPDGIK